MTHLRECDISEYPHRSNQTLVKYDNNRGGHLLTEHMIRQGCKRIAFVGIPNVSSAAALTLASELSRLASTVSTTMGYSRGSLIFNAAAWRLR